MNPMVRWVHLKSKPCGKVPEESEYQRAQAWTASVQPRETQDSDTIAAGHGQKIPCQQQKFCSATEETQLHSHRCPAHPLLPNLLHDKKWQQHGRAFIQKN